MYSDDLLRSICAKLEILTGTLNKIAIECGNKSDNRILAENTREIQYNNMLKELELGLISKEEFCASEAYRNRHVKIKKR